MRLIDADTLKKDSNTKFGSVLDAVILNRFIDKAKTVDAKLVVHAYWDENYCCSNCHGDAPCDDTGCVITTDYCPSCGATMDKVIKK